MSLVWLISESCWLVFLPLSPSFHGECVVISIADWSPIVPRPTYPTPVLSLLCPCPVPLFRVSSFVSNESSTQHLIGLADYHWEWSVAMALICLLWDWSVAMKETCWCVDMLFKPAWCTGSSAEGWSVQAPAFCIFLSLSSLSSYSPHPFCHVGLAFNFSVMMTGADVFDIDCFIINNNSLASWIEIFQKKQRRAVFFLFICHMCGWNVAVLMVHEKTKWGSSRFRFDCNEFCLNDEAPTLTDGIRIAIILWVFLVSCKDSAHPSIIIYDWLGWLWLHVAKLWMQVSNIILFKKKKKLKIQKK